MKELTRDKLIVSFAALLIFMLALFFFHTSNGKSAVVKKGNPYENYSRTGVASWYGKYFHGRETANGESFNMHSYTAAHRSLPLGTEVIVTNLKNGKDVEVRINDRGPYADGRVIDLSYAAAKSIGMIEKGTAKVRVEVVSVPKEGKNK